MTREMPLIAHRGTRARQVWGRSARSRRSSPSGRRRHHLHVRPGVDRRRAEPHLATPTRTWRFEGRTAYGDESRMPFHVSSADWQESDRVFAGILTAFGSQTNAIPIGGYGTFDGVMLGNTSRARASRATFAGEQMRAFDVTWGSGEAPPSSRTATPTSRTCVDQVRRVDDHADGRFSLGFPRKDGGEEINARDPRSSSGRSTDLRHAFELDDYTWTALLSGEFHVYGSTSRPFGFGTMAIADGVAYGEPFESATADAAARGRRRRGSTTSSVVKGGGRGHGHRLRRLGRHLLVQLRRARHSRRNRSPRPRARRRRCPGCCDFTAGGSGTFERRATTCSGTVRDFFVADEGIGQVSGRHQHQQRPDDLKIEAASPRLAVSGSRTHRARRRDGRRADVHGRRHVARSRTSARSMPQLSPYTTAVASGTVRVVGELADIDHLLVDTTVDKLDLRLFDYALRNAVPIRMALDAIRSASTRHAAGGDRTPSSMSRASSTCTTSGSRCGPTATPTSAVLQGFVSNIRSSGTRRAGGDARRADATIPS